MTKESIKAYTARIAQATKTELVVIMYEIILEDIKEAKSAWETSDMEKYRKDLKHSSSFVYELMRTLDYNYPIAFQLMSLYIYTNKCIIRAIHEKNPELLEGAKLVIDKLCAGFQGICKEDLSGPVMKNTPKLYAGLTYSKGALNEIDIDPGLNRRGFKA